jgi:hypothetical protein
MKGRKRTNTEQKWIKGENPGISIIIIIIIIIIKPA